MFDHRCQMSSSIKKICVSSVLQVEETNKPGCYTPNVPLFVSGWKSTQKICLYDIHDKYLYNNKKHSSIKSSSMPFSQKRFSCSCESQRKTVDLGLNWLHNYTIKSTHAQACTRSHIRKLPSTCISNFVYSQVWINIVLKGQRGLGKYSGLQFERSGEKQCRNIIEARPE